MKMRLFILLFIGMPQLILAQMSLQGHVVGGTKQEPLPFATVFLANTTKGTLTDENGSFTLTNVPPGKFDLIVSFVGFTSLKTTIQTQEAKIYRFVLKPRENQLGAVTVTARRQRNSERAKQLAVFTDYFIGTSANASQCRLINPQMLAFRQTADTLIATSEEPLLIENKALGYRLKIQLSQFTYIYSTQTVVYDADPVFESMVPVDSAQASAWIISRRKAYNGSIMHFMRALYRKQLIEEGFAVQKIMARQNSQKERLLVGLPGDTTLSIPSVANVKKWVTLPVASYNRFLDTLQSTPQQPVLAFPDYLQITYTKERQPYTYQASRVFTRFGHKVEPQTSLVHLMTDRVAIEQNGQMWPSLGIKSEGYWAWELIADELPFDYDPLSSSL